MRSPRSGSRWARARRSRSRVIAATNTAPDQPGPPCEASDVACGEGARVDSGAIRSGFRVAVDLATSGADECRSGGGADRRGTAWAPQPVLRASSRLVSGSPGVGMVKWCPQCLHRACLPAAEAFTEPVAAQEGQANDMVIGRAPLRMVAIDGRSIDRDMASGVDERTRGNGLRSSVRDLRRAS